MPKILCPFHNDTNASMEVYPDGRGFCFVCWKGAKLDQIQDIGDVPEVVERPAEDLEAAVRRIRALPMERIRGLKLHANEQGYFILWPNGEYYKFRKYSSEPRYLAPRGHSQPLFFACQMAVPRGLVIVEGEINALSVAEAARQLSYDVVSPGPAGNFSSLSEELIALAGNYEQTLIWTDQDTAGIKALWALAPKLKATSGRMSFFNNEADANEILIEQGTGGLLDILGAFNERGSN